MNAWPIDTLHWRSTRGAAYFLPILLLLLLSCQRQVPLSPDELALTERSPEFYARGLDSLQTIQEAKQEAEIRARCGPIDTVITLARRPGLNPKGFRRTYDLSLCGNGTVWYRGSECVRVGGLQSAKIDPRQVQKLAQAFQDAGYFTMSDNRPRVTDCPTTYTSITLGKHHKAVTDYAGGAPEQLHKLEDMIDQVAESNRWLNIDAAQVKEKVAEGWNVRGREASLLLLRAAQAGDTDTVRAFIEAGADVNSRIDVDDWMYCLSPRRVNSPSKSITPLSRARGLEVVKLLIDAGANVNPKTSLDPPLQFQAETLGDAASVQALAEAGANLEARPTGVTALIAATRTHKPGVVEVLLRSGAKVNTKNRFGETALDFAPQQATNTAEEIEVRRLLLSAGATPAKGTAKRMH